MYARINPIKFGLAGGILWGLLIFVLTWLAIWTNYSSMWLIPLMDIYPGFHIGMGGSFIGLIYGFINGFIYLFLIGWVYNLLKP